VSEDPVDVAPEDLVDVAPADPVDEDPADGPLGGLEAPVAMLMLFETA
jgi:hypothetical protein